MVQEMKRKQKIVYGPVPSRRLGLSLGVDLVPFKTCNFDCVYCQLGRTRHKTVERKPYVEANAVARDIVDVLREAPTPDFITLAGSGEPTLNSSIGDIITSIKETTDIPIAVLTNGSLLSEKKVRDELMHADVVLPSLDAGDDATFKKINRAHESVRFEKLVEGLCEFRKEFPGAIWLEVFLVESINTSKEKLKSLKEKIKRIGPDKVQLNTAVRPTADQKIKPVSHEMLSNISLTLGKDAEVIADFASHGALKPKGVDTDKILATLSRRPCRLIDLSVGLGVNPGELLKSLTDLQRKGVVKTSFQDKELYYMKS